MKRLILAISLVFLAFNGFAQVAKKDTCISKEDLHMARLYVKSLEDYKQQSDIKIALFELRAKQSNDAYDSVSNQNEALKTSLNDCQKNQKVTGWVVGGLGFLVGFLVATTLN